MRRWIKWVIGVVILALVIWITPFVLMITAFILPVFYEPTVYLLPKNFTGPVEIHYQIPTAPALPKEGQHVVISIPESGKLETSTPPVSGTMNFYRVDAQGQRSEMPQDCVTNEVIGDHQEQRRDGTVVKYPPIERFIVTACESR